MLKSAFRVAYLVLFAIRVACLPPTVTTTIITTTTIFPSITTVWITLRTLTTTVWAFTTTEYSSSGCLTYTDIYPPKVSTTQPVSTTPTSAPTTTATVTIQSTVTETNSKSDRITGPTYHVVTVSSTEGRTNHLIKCTNTLVRSIYVPTVYTFTYTKAKEYTSVVQTSVCMTSTTRWTEIPGVTLTPTPWINDEDRFTAGTIVTTPYSLYSSVWVTVTSPTSTETSIACNNPSVDIVSTYFTVTFTPSTSTIYQSRTGCSGSSTQSQIVAPTATFAPLVNAAGQPGNNDGQRASSSINVEPPAPTLEFSAFVERRATSSIAPAESKTVVYTTPFLINGTVTTLTGTAVVDYYTRTFTTIHEVGLSITVTATVTSSVCSVPTARVTLESIV